MPLGERGLRHRTSGTTRLIGELILGFFDLGSLDESFEFGVRVAENHFAAFVVTRESNDSRVQQSLSCL